MSATAARLPEDQIAALREKHYNATITHLDKPNDRLVRLRVRLDEDVREDGPALHYQPGQYTTLGLGYWEDRLELAQAEALDTRAMERVVKRAYSISCRLLDDAGDVAPAGDEAEPEVYIALVTEADKPPAFTPRLFLLKEGDRIQMGAKAKGHFTLGDPGVDGVRPTDNVVFAGTGTGEAPHNAMLSKLLAEHHQGKIANICCARYRSDLGYLDEHARLMEKFPGYRYVPLTTREPENRDKDHPQYVGARYVQALMASPTAADELGFELDPATTKVFLCGNPAMIGIPNKDGHPDGRHPKPQGAVEVLEGLGFKAHEARAKEGEAPGNIFYEKYW